ncbi:uncharacterized protein [Littorina saxatilis]|uniref:uncharacterized protein n=1 Tax=Littorina saxatilis TaxID=31220 RepID=UPI0038B5585E
MSLLMVALHVMLAFSLADANLLSIDELVYGPENYSQVPCNFSVDSCGWENVGGIYTLRWKREPGFMELNMKRNYKDKGRLASPWLPPLPGYKCRLSFQYFIPFPNWSDCRLSLIRLTDEGEQTIGSTTQYTGFDDRFSKLVAERVKCDDVPYRMVFEGSQFCRKIDWLKLLDDSIRVKNVIFEVCPPPQAELMSTTESHKSVGNLMKRRVASPKKKRTCDWEEYDGLDSHPSTNTLGNGPLAGIVIASVVFVALVAGAIIAVLKRQKPRDECEHRLLAGLRSDSNTYDGIGAYQEVSLGAYDEGEEERSENNNGRMEASNTLRTADVYNRLGANDVPTAKHGCPENHYDHFTDTGGQYSTTNEEGRRRDQHRDMAAYQYSHI